VGFGLFFVGIDVLKTAFESVVQVFDISQFAADGIRGTLIFLLIGIVMTILTQSSSASIALTITAASSDMVGLYAAGAMIVGANIGTTSTAMIASIGATSPAKRVAAAQVIFNLVTASVALIILPVLFYFIAAITETLDIVSNPAISLALFHSTFNILGVLLVYPHNDRLVAFLEKRFCSWEEKESHPRFLDKTIAQTPVLAINAIALEILALCDRIITLYNKAIQPDKFAPKTIDDEAKVIKALSSEVTSFIVSVNSTEQEGGAANHLALLMRVDHYLANCLLSAERLADQLRSRSRPASALLKSETTEFLEQVSEFMRVSRSASYAVGTVFSELFSQLQAEHDKLKASFIEAGTRSKVPVDQMSESIDSLAEAMQLAQQWFKAFTRLHSIQAELEVSVISAQESVSIHNNYPPLPGRQLDTSTEIKP
jgi:phosphate:Na+ symporter